MQPLIEFAHKDNKRPYEYPERMALAIKKAQKFLEHGNRANSNNIFIFQNLRNFSKKLCIFLIEKNLLMY